MTRIVSAQLPEDLARKFHTRQNENHKTQTDFLVQIVRAYFEFEADGYLNQDGNKLDKLQTELVLREKLRAVQAGIAHDKLEYEKELIKLREEEKRKQALERALRKIPRVDWKGSAGGYVEGASDSFVLGDR